VEAPAGEERAGWGAALALAGATLLLSILDPFSLVVLPLAVALLVLPPRRLATIGIALLLAASAFLIVPTTGSFALLGRGWALLLGGAFALTALAWPALGFISRALVAVAASLGIAALAAALGGGWKGVDWVMAEHFRTAANLTSHQLAAQLPDSRWAADFTAAAGRVAHWQGQLFPALLALESLAALALVWWLFARSAARGGVAVRPLAPLREFRFPDPLVWVGIVGLLLLVLPLGGVATRLGANALLFMGVLYALRGVAIFVYLARGASSVFSIVLGAIAAVFFYPLVLTAALLIGLGDTWLDVRGRVALASRGAS
jgi:hypothetical protein